MTCRSATVCALMLAASLLAGCAQAGAGVTPAADDDRAARAVERASRQPRAAGRGDADATATSARPMAATTAADDTVDPLDLPPETTAMPGQDPGTFESGRVVPVTVYFVRKWSGRLYLVPERRQTGSGGGALEGAARLALSEQPTWGGAANPFPAGTRLLGFALLDGTAVLDLSSEILDWRGSAEEARYATQALACTLAGAGPVRRVRVRVEGRVAGLLGGHDIAKLWDGIAVSRPVEPDPAVRLAPITLAHPRPGATVTDARLWIQGEASTVQGTVSLRLRDADGQVVAQNFTTAEEKAPKRGAFSAALPFTPPRRPAVWTLEVFEADPGDGTITYQVQVPVRVGG